MTKQRMNPNELSSYCTTVYNSMGRMWVIYQHTAIVSWDDCSIKLNSGGYESSTTKRKMNQASNQFGLGYQVYQNDFTWYITYKGKTLPFKDNMILDRITGKIT